MTVGKLALDVWAGVVALALAGIGLFFVAGVVVSALTVASARRRRRAPSCVNALARWCSVNDLAEMDEALDRIWAGHHGTTLGRGIR